MLYGLYISAGGLKATDRQMDVLANNMANVQTVGFKLDRVAIESLPRPADRVGNAGNIPELAGLGGGVFARRTVTDLTAGQLEQTNQPTDIALDTDRMADGFLGVQAANGQVRWTRDGRLGVDSTGRLVMQSNHHPVLDDRGQTMRIDPSGGPISVDATGVVKQGSNELGRLKLTTFSNPQDLVKEGSNLFAAPARCPAKPFTGRVIQGYIEGSGVEPTATLVQMIQTQRAYEANAKMISLQDDTLNRAVNDIARLT